MIIIKKIIFRYSISLLFLAVFQASTPMLQANKKTISVLQKSLFFVIIVAIAKAADKTIIQHQAEASFLPICIKHPFSYIHNIISYYPSVYRNIVEKYKYYNQNAIKIKFQMTQIKKYENASVYYESLKQEIERDLPNSHTNFDQHYTEKWETIKNILIKCKKKIDKKNIANIDKAIEELNTKYCSTLLLTLKKHFESKQNLMQNLKTIFNTIEKSLKNDPTLINLFIQQCITETKKDARDSDESNFAHNMKNIAINLPLYFSDNQIVSVILNNNNFKLFLNEQTQIQTNFITDQVAEILEIEGALASLACSTENITILTLYIIKNNTSTDELTKIKVTNAKKALKNWKNKAKDCLESCGARDISTAGEEKADFETLKTNKGFAPLLLLDDVFEKLDDNRMAHLLNLVCLQNDGQVFITDTHCDRLEAAFSELGVANQIIQL